MDSAEDLVGIDVADAGDELLIHQRRLELAAAVREQRIELRLRERGRERVGPELVRRDEGVGILDPADAPELAAVDEGEVGAAREIEAHAVELGIVLFISEVVEAARHAEVHGDPAALIELGEELLAVALGGDERTALHGVQLRARKSAHDDRVVDVHACNALLQRVLLQIAPVVLDVGELGHDGNTLAAISAPLPV